jgi:MYXO-CTERM domain-containing protein
MMTLRRGARTAVACGAGVLLAAWAAPARAATLEVGPGKTYAAPCAAIAAASSGDVIEIDAAGNYDGDVCEWSTDGLTLRGVGGMAKIDAAGQSSGGKGIWVISGDDTVVENIEFSGATVPSMNGAGIRHQGGNLTVRGCYFHDNEDGILAGDNASAEILIEHTEFANNGYGDGLSHNFYINHVARFTLRFCYSHSADTGHLAKTRAAENHILYNRLSTEGGTSSFELDISNGGRSYVIGNVFHQSNTSPNGGIVAYQQEGPHAMNPSDELFVVNNTFVNDRVNGGTFVQVGGAVSTPAVVRNNIFVGAGTVVSQGSAVFQGNYEGDPSFENQAASDFRLQMGSPAAEAGVAPGMGAGMSLEPTHHYLHPLSMVGRMTVGVIDAGAYELGGDVVGGGGAGGAGAGAGGAASGAGGAASSSGAAATSSGAGGGAASSGSAGTGGNQGAVDGDDGGCGCRTAGAPERGAWWWMLVALGLATARRRR